MTDTGRCIVVEGLEGAGKSTAIETIKEFLASRGIRTIVTREPGGTRVGEVVRALIKETAAHEKLNNRSELLLFYAARAQLLEQVIKPALARGDWVISDRFELSSYAYQGGGRGIDKSVLDCLSSFCLAGFKPDLLIFLDIKPGKGLERVRLRGEMDRIEQESMVFFEKVYQAYHQAIQNNPNVVLIDAEQSLEFVQSALVRQLNKALFSNAGN